jgi:TPR repeat protein
MIFLERSAKCDNQKAFVPYGFHLLNGIYVSKNEEEPVFYFQKAAAIHQREGKFWFGFCMIEGKGIKQSYYRGLEMVRQSFSQIYLISQLYLPTIEPLRRSLKY